MIDPEDIPVPELPHEIAAELADTSDEDDSEYDMAMTPAEIADAATPTPASAKKAVTHKDDFVLWSLLPNINTEAPGWFTGTTVVNNQVWVAGKGAVPSPLMIILPQATRDAVMTQNIINSDDFSELRKSLKRMGLELTPESCYVTSATKFLPNGGKPLIKDMNVCRHSLFCEIDRVQPRVIVTCGAQAIEAVTIKRPGPKAGKFTLQACRGQELRVQHLPQTVIIPIWSPAFLLRFPERQAEFNSDLARIVAQVNGAAATAKAEFKYTVIDSVSGLADWAQQFTPGQDIWFSLDAEWMGSSPMDNKGKLRSLQLDYRGPDNSFNTVIFRFMNTVLPVPEEPPPGVAAPVAADPQVGVTLPSYSGLVNSELAQAIAEDQGLPCVALESVVEALKYLAETCKLNIVGQNLPSDGLWLLFAGFDIRPYVRFDTMLAEHLIQNTSEKGLEVLTMKYACWAGRYDDVLTKLVAANKGVTERYGYGWIPEKILFPYAAADVQVIWDIMTAQLPQLQSGGYLDSRAPEQDIPSLYESVLNLANHSYELHMTGVLVSQPRLEALTKLYNDKLDHLHNLLVEIGNNHGIANFNPNSTQQKALLLFGPKAQGYLGLTPVRSTNDKPWDWVMRQPESVQAQYRPAVDGDSLNIIKAESPEALLFFQYDKVHTVVKNLLSRPGSDGGLRAHIWNDGRIHSEFLQLTNTGRMSTRKPNSQNFPKAAEKDWKDIFKHEKEAIVAEAKKALAEAGDDRKPELAAALKKLEKAAYPPPIRSLFVPAPGHVFLEADYKQAELFVLAGMSGDPVLYGELSTRGRDLHDSVALRSFHITVLVDDGKTPYDDAKHLAFAAAHDDDALDKLMGGYIYVMPDGKTMTRKEFKSAPRVSAKAVNFGIPYGRGAAAIAFQIRCDAGIDVSVEEVQNTIDTWKRTYVDAWKFLEQSQGLANTRRYVEDAWGRRRYFPVALNRGQEASNSREASNHPIQGTVADTIAIALHRIQTMRNDLGLKFKVANQIHDALLWEVPESEIDVAKEIVEWGMGGFTIPMKKPLRLGVDIEIKTATEI